MTDQQRGDSVLAHTQAKMPNVDKFRGEGVTFTQAHCPSPHCCPSRATFFTGVMPTEHGVWHNVGVANALSRGLKKGCRTWSEDLSENGYSMYYCGKWHVSDLESPEDRGWQKADGGSFHKAGLNYNYPNWDRICKEGDLPSNQARQPGEILRSGYPDYTHYGISENPHGDNDVVNEGLTRLKKLKGSATPWCLYVGTLGPHDPYFVPQRFLEMYSIDDIELPENFQDDFSNRPNLYKRTRDVFNQLSTAEHKEAIRHYLAFCSYEDFLFGEMLKGLAEQGDAENTLVLYLSDHGDYMGEHGLWTKGLPCFKGAYHIPMIMRWPAGIENPGRSIDSFVGLDSCAPTFLDITKISTARSFSSDSLLPFLQDKPPACWPDAYFTQSNGNELYGIQRSVTTREYKLVYNGFDYDELYDLKNDPGESCNLINDLLCEGIIKELYVKLWKYGKENNETCTNSYIMVGLAKHGPGVVNL